VYCVGISFDNKFVVSGSRDKSVKVFSLEEENKTIQQKCLLKFNSGVTAVEFADEKIEAIGNEKIEGVENGYL